MALLAEELVVEWLNRQGYFTIRGIKLGVHEIDLLAIRPKGNTLECRQVEVQASVRPVSYITRVPIEVQRKTGRAGGSAKLRQDAELRQGIREWVKKKFDHPEKRRLREHLAPGPWSRELVVHVVKHDRELELIEEEGVASNYLVTLEVTGRKSGRTFSLPLVMAVVDGQRYLVSMLGDNAQWVHNVRAAGGRAVLRSGGREEIQLEEVPADQRAPILRAYLQRAPGARSHVPVNKDAALAEFQKVAAAFPVFRLASNKAVQPTRPSGPRG